MKTERTKTGYVQVNVSVFASDILEFLRVAGGFKPTNDVKIYVLVPGGGDCSNTDLEIDNETPVRVIWTEKSKEGKT